jgi:hypothetical protein
LPSYFSEFDPKAYVNWEMEVAKEFRKFELSEKQKVTTASMVLTNYSLNLLKCLARHDKVTKTWKDMKRNFRKECVPEYYANYLLAKLHFLKQGKKSIAVYYNDLKFHMLHCSLEECEETIENRFLRGLNTKIQDRLLHEAYDSLSCLIELASKIEIQLATTLSEVSKKLPTCQEKNSFNLIPFVVCSAMTNFGQDEKDLVEHPSKKESENSKCVCAEISHVNEKTCDLIVDQCEPIALVLNLSTTPASLEQSLVELVAVFPLLQDNYKIVPCDKEKFCDHASLISTIQLVHGHDNSILDDRHAEVRRGHCIDSEKEELKITSSLNCLGYIKFDFVCDLNSLDNELFQKSGLLYFDYCSFPTIGLCDKNNKYIVQRVYTCSHLKTSLMVSLSDQIMTCIQTNNTISSFSTVDHMLQVNF